MWPAHSYRVGTMRSSQQDLTGYFAAACGLRSDFPTVRRPAIAALLELAQQATGPVRASAERSLTEEFGPYAISEGLPACTAPARVVEACDGDCRSCPWLWLDELSTETERDVPLLSDIQLSAAVIQGFL